MEFEGIRNHSINKIPYIKKIERTNETEYIKYDKLKGDGKRKKKSGAENSQENLEDEDLFDDETGKVLDIKL